MSALRPRCTCTAAALLGLLIPLFSSVSANSTSSSTTEADTKQATIVARGLQRLVSGKTLSEKATRQELERLDAREREVMVLVRTGKPLEAYTKVNRLVDDMVSSFVSGPIVNQYLGRAVALLAVAAYDLGRPDEAVWHWQAGNQIFPAAGVFDLEPYGEAGAHLRSAGPGRSPRTVNETGPEIGDEPFEVDESKDLDRRMTPPRKLRTPKPRFPYAKLGTRLIVVAEVIIDRDGRVREPRIVQGRGEPTFVWAVLKAMSEWEFAPALRDGEEIRVLYQLTVNFRMRKDKKRSPN